MQLMAQTLVGLALAFSFSQCSYEPEISNSGVQLSFSTDTIQFDTLFTERNSISKRLKVFNPSKEAIRIEQLNLEAYPEDFNLTVNGIKGDVFNDLLLFGEDSLLVIIEANIDQTDSNNPFVIRDLLKVSNAGIEQSVVIEAWGQNAHYLSDSILSCDSYWPADKPYVLSNNILIDEGCKLTIAPGAKIYSGPESFFLVAGQLEAIGKADSLIQFTNDRLDEPFASAPGQWGGIIFLEGSTNNHMKYTSIQNAIVGVNVATYSADGNYDLNLENVKIGNVSTQAMLILNSDVSAINSLFYNSVSSTYVHIGGGKTYLEHCTIANYLGVQRELPAFYLSDSAIDNEENQIVGPVSAEVKYSMISGRINEEMGFYESQTGNLQLNINNNLLKTKLDSFSDSNNLLNVDPGFKNIFEANFDLSETSPAIDQAIDSQQLIDILGRARTNTADLGAFEYSPDQQ